MTDSELRACNEALAEFGFTTSRADLDEDAGNEDATNSTLGYRQDQPWGGDELRRELCNRDPDIASRFAARPARPASAHARSGTDWRSARTLVLTRADQCRRPDASRKCLAEAQQIIETTDERYSEAEVYRLRGDLLSTLGDLVGAEQEYHQALGIAKRESARPLSYAPPLALLAFGAIKVSPSKIAICSRQSTTGLRKASTRQFSKEPRRCWSSCHHEPGPRVAGDDRPRP